MWRRQKALAALQDELRTIDVFDRVHDYSANADPADNQAYAVRRLRRAVIIAEIQKLNESKSKRNPFRVGSAAVFTSAVANTALHYLLRLMRW
jgi:hypothetical protein